MIYSGQSLKILEKPIHMKQIPDSSKHISLKFQINQDWDEDRGHPTFSHSPHGNNIRTINQTHSGFESFKIVYYTRMIMWHRETLPLKMLIVCDFQRLSMLNRRNHRWRTLNYASRQRTEQCPATRLTKTVPTTRPFQTHQQKHKIRVTQFSKTTTQQKTHQNFNPKLPRTTNSSNSHHNYASYDQIQ